MSDDDNVALLPCPFCGHTTINVALGRAECDRCEARVPGEDNADAIAAWNRRAGLEAVRRETIEALNRYRYAIEWVSADSWDHCEDCRSRLAWARSMDGDPMTANQIAEVGKSYLAYENREAIRSLTQEGAAEVEGQDGVQPSKTTADRRCKTGDENLK